jgi:hypothetical protein
MTLQAQWNLTYDDHFRSRSRACITNQAAVFGAGDIPVEVALAQDLLLEDAQKISTFLTLLAGYQDFDVLVDNGDGTVDSTKLTDEQILEAVDALFPTVADLFYGGSPNIVVPEVTSVSPTSGIQAAPITVTGVGLTEATLVNVGNDCTDLVVVSDTTLTAAISNPKPAKGFYPVLVTVGGNVVSGPNFQIT